MAECPQTAAVWVNIDVGRESSGGVEHRELHDVLPEQRILGTKHGDVEGGVVGDEHDIFVVESCEIARDDVGDICELGLVGKVVIGEAVNASRVGVYGYGWANQIDSSFVDEPGLAVNDADGYCSQVVAVGDGFDVDDDEASCSPERCDGADCVAWIEFGWPGHRSPRWAARSVSRVVSRSDE